MITIPLLNSIPAKMALQMMLTGKRLGADEALHAGLVTEVSPHAELGKAVQRLLEELTAASPQAVALARAAFSGHLAPKSRVSPADAAGHVDCIAQDV